MLTPMMIQYLVGLCCLRHDPDAVEITLGDMVYDHVAEKDRDVDITITFKDGVRAGRKQPFRVGRKSPILAGRKSPISTGQEIALCHETVKAPATPRLWRP